MTSGIYKITNLVNGKVYIGSAVNPERRKYQHFSALRKDKHHNPHLQASFNKYGEGSFKFSVINTVLFETDLVRQEQRLIDYYSKILGWENLYNVRVIAKSNLGFKQSAESRKKMSLAQKGEKNHCWGKFGADHHSSKPVEAICIKTGKTTLFTNARDAARQWPVNYKSISACCLGKKKTHKKHVWRFV